MISDHVKEKIGKGEHCFIIMQINYGYEPTSESEAKNLPTLRIPKRCLSTVFKASHATELNTGNDNI
jgi:hypothetical protein